MPSRCGRRRGPCSSRRTTYDPPGVQTMKVKSLISLVAAGVLSTSAFGADPFNIDVVLPLTGAAAFLGKAEQISLQQAEKSLAKTEGIGGRPVKFVFHDDQSNPQIAVQLANQIVAAKPAV